MQYLKFVLAVLFTSESKPGAPSPLLHFCEHLFSLLPGLFDLLLNTFQAVGGRQFVAFTVLGHTKYQGVYTTVRVPAWLGFVLPLQRQRTC
jgi:hypothetical protein